MPCECCGTPLRANASKCYVRGCIAYKLDVTELDAERARLVDFLGGLTYDGCV